MIEHKLDYGLCSANFPFCQQDTFVVGIFLPLKIRSFFAVLPKRPIANATLWANREKKNEDAIFKYTGIYQRRYALPEECASDLGYHAAFYPLVHEDLPVKSILFATTSGDYPSPASAHMLHKKLNLGSACHCLDVASSCTSFLSALRSASGFLEEESACLIIASEVKHKSLDENDLRTTSLFGDGAGGMVASRTTQEESSFLFTYQEVNSSLIENIITPVGGSKEPITKFNLERNKLHLFEPKKMYQEIVKSILRALETSLQEYDPDCIFIHQANANIIRDVKERLDPRIAKKIPLLMSDVGNMVCASLPVLICRLEFLRALFFALAQEGRQKEFIDGNLPALFQEICNQNAHFKWEILFEGIQFSCSLFPQKLFLLDEAATHLSNSWLGRLGEEEKKELFPLFTESYFRKTQERSTLWIAAGGGFQCIAGIFISP